MADFTLFGGSTTARTLIGSEQGFIAPNAGLSVTGADAVEATTGTNWLTVLGYLNTRGGGFAAVDANGSVFEMQVGQGAFITAENPSGGVLDIDVATLFSLFNEGTISSTNDRAVEFNDTDGFANFFLNNAGRINSFSGEAIYANVGAGDVDFFNSGEIFAQGEGVEILFDSTATIEASYINTGSISSTESNAVRVANGTGDSIFQNSGMIIADASGVEFDRNGDVELFNSGTIQGKDESIEIEGGDDLVVNTGTLIGDVRLGSGNDTIDTRDGVISGIVYGEAGNDTYIVSDTSIEIGESTLPSGGVDAVLSTVSYRLLNSSIENLTLLGQTATRGAGNGGSNTLVGNIADNDLHGFAGDDSLVGNEGDDKLFGSSGEDTLAGGQGNDWLHGGANDDVLNGGTGNDMLDGGTGNDQILASEGMNLVRAGTGDDLVIANNVQGEGQNVDLGSGDDQVFAGSGADTLDGGAGTDILNYAFSDGRVTVNLGVGFFANGYAAGDSATGFENLVGSTFNDVLVGSSGANRITANAGNNQLRGEGGEDILLSGSGNDTLNGGSGADTADYSLSMARVIVNLGTGFTSGGFSDGDQLISIERVVGSSFNDRIVGSDGGNRLFGGASDDYLDGGLAADLLYGGTGNDELIGGAGADQFVFEAMWGDDQINDFQDGTDLINFRLLPAVTGFGDLTVTIDGSDLVITAAGMSDSIRLINQNGVATITADDFLFA
ncbi:hypothetical protein JANAI62_18680 [Jannaschia pagri]|uniref:Hemolysin-type calcium-binding repeat-containing protein n=1 Tax=Jannaschia pagri TaxID=2829797 RepID=A0ABQ4NLF6_9RHOB|nr:MULTISPECIES: calcium-binding protein [unclassified Jannaschia]GIT91411.1 hypothetical protein JANAI61_18690 [Jannaschia sp. AI_61]GIT95245.1 hypothetical protein JANAI62_18680 [Jannaschia sp. AI_62]